MSYGLLIENPNTGAVVVSSDALTYRYLGAPTLVSAGSLSPTHNPYTYRVTMPSPAAVPMVGIVLDQSRVTVIQGVYRTPGSSDQWDILVFSVARSGCTDKTTISLAPPSIKVFSPPVSGGGGGWGLQLFNAAGALTGDFSYTPLWVHEVANFPLRFGGYDPVSGTWDNAAHLDGDEQPLTRTTNIAIVGGAFGSAEETWAETGEAMNYWLYGWTLSGSNLRRQRFWQNDGKPTLTFDPLYDSLAFTMTAAKALLVDASLL